MSHEQTKTNVIRLCSPYIYLGHRVTHDHSAYIHSTESPNTAKTCHSINGTLSIEQWRDGTNPSLPEDNKWMCRRHVYFGIDGTKLCRRWYNCLQWATARCLLRMLQVYYCECDAFFFLVDGWVVWVAQNNFLMSPVCCFAFVARLCLSRNHRIWRASHSHPRTLQSPISYSPATTYRAFTPFSIMCRKQNETKILKHRSNPSNGD